MSSNTVGRPREFDIDDALQKALNVFWNKGYEGTSLPDLTKAMGINRPSIYSTFGNKEQLFLKAVELYESQVGGFFYPSLNEPTAYKVAERILLGAAAEYGNPHNPKGCMMVQSALACSDSGQSVKNELIARRQMGYSRLVVRFQEAVTSGDLDNDTDPEALAAFILTVVQGLSIQATNGACAMQLHKVAIVALQAFTSLK
ncbi:TetR/AcrR family transcriptional regulator [Shewanella mangrovisoli]|uniref:TetR/AcrR family transcriptional regulator n=1 Tax=Shewanella mangrovisoli TaxID=2864211 RepID=UPI0035B82DF3